MRVGRRGRRMKVVGSGPSPPLKPSNPGPCSTTPAVGGNCLHTTAGQASSGTQARTAGELGESMSELHHECGIAAVYHLPGELHPLCPEGGPDEISRLLPRMLLDIQNRGQLAAGMTSFNPSREQLLETHKDIGTVTRGLSPVAPRQGREPDAAICRPGGDRPRALCHLRRRRPQLRPAVRAAAPGKAQVVRVRLQRAAGEFSGAARTSCSARPTITWPARTTPKSSCTRSAASCRATAGRGWST